MGRGRSTKLGSGRAKDARHIRLYHSMLRTPAWRSLTVQAIAVYLALEEIHNGSNNGEIGLSVRDAARRCHINKDTAAKAFRELQEKGLIKLRQPGAFTYKKRHSAEWELT